MLVEQAFLGNAAGTGRLDVAGIVGGDHVGAHQTNEYAGGQQAQGKSRQHGMAQHVKQYGHVAQLNRVDDVEAGRRHQSRELHFAAERRTSGCRQHVQPDGEDELQNQAEEEHRGGIAQDGEGADARIGRVVTLACGDASQADADDERDDEREERQFECGGAVVDEDAADLLVVGQRGTEIAVQQAAKIIDVLHDERTVVAGRVDALLQFFRGQAAAECGGDRVAGGAHHEENDGYKNEYCRNDQQKACEHETEESA